MIARCFGVYLFSLVFLLTGSASAQVGLPAPAPTQPEVPQDALGRTTPRGTVRAFLSAAGKGDYATAAHYLNTTLRGEAAASLSRQLYVVLNRSLPVRLNAISDQPEGSLPFPAEPDKELIGTIPSETGNVDILLQRLEVKNAGSLWLFSRQTLDAIPELYAEVNAESRPGAVTRFLLQTKIAHIALVHWLGLFVGLPLLYFIGARMNRLLSRFVGGMRRRLRKNPHLPNPEFLPVPVRLLLVAFGIRWTLSAITLTLLAREVWSSIATILIVSGCVWLIIRLNRRLEAKIHLRLGRRNLTGALSILGFARWAVDVLVIFIGLLALLNHFDINANTALAGLGVGGIAVALAAQKTLENVIAGISLISDKAIRVGDFLKVGDTVGTVNDIGLRSTRIRTLDRTMVNVPNGQIANASLENFSLRDQFWFHHIFGVTYETTVSQMRSILNELTKLLSERNEVLKPSIQVRFLRFGASSLDIEMFTYVTARDWKDFLRIQQELLLQVMDAVQAAGARIALPSRTMYLATHADDGSRAEAGIRRFTGQSA